MPLRRVRDWKPAAAIARETLLEQLAQEVLRGRLDKELFSDGRGILSMAPLYGLTSDELRKGRFEQAEKIGWRYFWVHPALEAGALLELHRDGDGRARVHRYKWTRMAVAIARAFEELDQLFAEDRTGYHPRFLRLAPVAMEALWLKSTGPDGTDRLFGVQPRMHGRAFKTNARQKLRKLLAGERATAAAARAAAAAASGRSAESRVGA